MLTANKLSWRRFTTARIAPSFNLQSATTGKLTSLEEVEAKSIILAFIPGVWAPWCRKFLDELEQNLPEIQQQHMSVLAVVSQNYEQLYRYARVQKMQIDILSDQAGVISKRYGVFDDTIQEPMRISKPAVFILDHNHQLVFTFTGKHLMDRPTVEDMIAKAQEVIKEFDAKAGWSAFPIWRFFKFLKRLTYAFH